MCLFWICSVGGPFLIVRGPGGGKFWGYLRCQVNIQNRAQRGGCKFVGPLDENLFIGKHQKYSWYEPKFTDRYLTE